MVEAQLIGRHISEFAGLIGFPVKLGVGRHPEVRKLERDVAPEAVLE